MQLFGLQPADLVLVLLLLLNALTFVVYGVDKWRARGGRWRIPERTLLLLAAFGGALGACLGMVVWNHKTSHKRFRYLVLSSSCSKGCWHSISCASIEPASFTSTSPFNSLIDRGPMERRNEPVLVSEVTSTARSVN